MNDHIGQFRQAIASAGLPAPDAIPDDGKFHRFSTNGKARDTSGWYVLHGDGIPAGSFGCWRSHMDSTWCAKADNTMTVAEREANKRRIKAMQAQREEEQAQLHTDAAKDAGKRLAASVVASDEHPYLKRKGIQPHSIKQAGDKLLIPMRDTAGTVHSLQTITPDGGKLFHPGGRVQGCYFSIGKPDGRLIVCEGFATGATIHEATGEAVAVAFNAGNLGAVAMALHKKYPELTIVIAADDDHLTPGNPGMTKAKTAALAVGGFVVAPRFPADRPAKATDFNDLAALIGLDAVRACFSEIWEFVC